MATANCTVAGWEWSYNSYSENPCVVAGLLEALCRNITSFAVPALLNSSYNYIGPKQGDLAAAKCECNTVTYSLFMACTACQNSTVEKWSAWDSNCPSLYVAQYPGTIPQGTAVPYWAYLNVTIADAFSPSLAQAAGRDPQATPSAISTMSSPTSSPSSVTASLPGSSGSSSGGPVSPNSASSHSKTNTGAIAGGVVGGVAFLAIIVGLILWYLKRKQSSKTGGNTVTLTEGSEYGETLYYAQAPPMKLYSPSDPTTFPLAANDPSSISGGTLYAPGSVPTRDRRTYTGAAEI